MIDYQGAYLDRTPIMGHEYVQQVAYKVQQSLDSLIIGDESVKIGHIQILELMLQL